MARYPYLIVVVALLAIVGCSSKSDSPLSWSVMELEAFVKEDGGFSQLSLTPSTDQANRYSGTGTFDSESVTCTVDVSENRISWNANSASTETRGEDGSYSKTTGLSLSGSRTF